MWNLIKAVLLALLLLPVPGLCWAQEQPITITPGQAAAALTYSIIKK